MQIQSSQKGPRTTGRTDGWTDILYCHSGDLNSWPAAACTARNYWRRELLPKSDEEYRMDIKTERHLSSTVPHWGPSDPSLVGNALQRWNPTLEINTTKNITTGPQMTIRTEILYCHSGDFNPCPAAACAARNYGPRKWLPKIDADDLTDRQTETRTHKLDWNPPGSFGPQCGDKILNIAYSNPRVFFQDRYWYPFYTFFISTYANNFTVKVSISAEIGVRIQGLTSKICNSPSTKSNLSCIT